jgi:ABC-2 type transport system permease protein
MAGSFLAVGCCLSAVTRSQVVAYILSVAVCFALVMAGLPAIQDLLTGLIPANMVTALSELSILHHFRAIARGVLDLRDLSYFSLSIVIWLIAGVVVLQLKRGE